MDSSLPFLLILILQLFFMHVNAKSSNKNLHTVQEILNSPKRDNPTFIRDRKLNKTLDKPEMPPTWTNRFRIPFDPAWMDYCDPYHCNDYSKMTCGLNRAKMKFKWFQSSCHLVLNNQCANYRGFLKFDLIDVRFCRAYVMFLRGGCMTECEDDVEPVCAQSAFDGHVVLFKNACALEAYNCRNSTLQEYDSVYMAVCQYYYGKDKTT